MTLLSNESRVAEALLSRPTIEVSHEILIVVGVFLCIIAVISTLGNGSFIAVLIRCRAWCRRDAHLILLLGMACSDLCVTIFGYPFTIISCFMGSWMFGDFVCKMYAFTCYTLSLISACTLVVISVFRYIVICKPQTKHRLTPHLSGLCLLGIVCYALIWTLSPFFGWSAYTYEPFGTSCSFDWYDSSTGGITYAIATTTFCYLTPLTIMGVCYHKIYRRVSQLKLDPLTPPPPLPEIGGVVNEDIHDENACLGRFCFDAALSFDTGFHHRHRNQRTYKIEIQVLKLNVLMVLTFFVIWSPYAIFSIVTLYYPEIPAFWYIFPTVFAKTSCMMNPILYGLTNASLRRQFRQLWAEICSCGRHQHKMEHHEDNLHRHFRSKGADGEGERPVYDKEGMYLGKVNQGTCMCSGCIQSRREVELLIRLQTQRNRDSEAHTMSLVVSQPIEDGQRDATRDAADSVQNRSQTQQQSVAG